MLALLNAGVGLVSTPGTGRTRSWEQCFSVADLARDTQRRPPAGMISAGCTTARFATLPPYEAYVDVDGDEHRGTDHGEVFAAPPPPPAPYQKGEYNPTGLGEQLARATARTGAVAYIGCNTGSQPCGLTLVEGFAQGLGQGRDAAPGRLLGRRRPLLLRPASGSPPQAQRRLVSAEHLLPGHEVHALRRPHAAARKSSGFNCRADR